VSSGVSTRSHPTEAVDDALWSAVGDPTRRRMLDLLLAEGGGTATSLSAGLPVTRQAVAKHLVVLDRAGLVHGATAGREKQYRVDSAQLARAVAQLADVGAAWDRRLRRIKEIAEAIEEKARDQGQGQADKTEEG
jgi:DNA-binding transcriptional ArsR family regulator